MITISAADLLEFATNLLSAPGVPAAQARFVAASLVGANLRGHDSHGVMRIPQYLTSLEQGDIWPDAPFQILRQSECFLVADGHWGFGQIQCMRLAEQVISQAQSQGVSVGTLRRSNHIGRLGEYCEKAAEAGLVSLMMVNTHGVARRVAPPGGKEPRLGTNPLAIGVPHQEGPVILDFGTSATAEGKVRVHRIAGKPCPEGWLLDNQGRPTTDANALYDDPPGTILPMGGSQAYKGFGLALMVEIFAGALSGGVCARQTPINQNGNCVFLLALDPERLGGQDHFHSEVSSLLAFVRSCVPIEGVQSMTLPGDPERQTLQVRTQTGIPFDEGNWSQLADLAKRLGVACSFRTRVAVDHDH